jgi:hypothetical protein
MTHVHLDWDGDIRIADSDPVMTFGDRKSYAEADIETEADYLVDTSPFPGASVLKLAYSNWITRYEAANGRMVIFCKSALATVFGEIPAHIYFKEC